MTLVSVIVPTYNRNDLLRDRSLASVVRQTHRDLEVHVVADGMKGEQLKGLRAVAREVRAKNPDIPFRFTNIARPKYPEDAGNMWSVQGWKARNHGLDHARGEWVAPLDDDDEWTDDHVEVLLGAAIKEGVDFAYGKAVTPTGQEYGYWPPSGMNFTDGSQVYRHDMGYRYDPKSITRWLPTDADLWNRMVAGGVTFTFVRELVHRYYPAAR